ncbi:UDP-N-acetylmuramate:L-alanyl-gamma-D-glutamyl-meso-diaminopimelate ligase [Sediminicurvatus halobius]|uniref:UDP-N-acetylmuramate:L-alanyl-gamma-D-glutamyl- meso-diaminopimelate ligase n=1 Tax=Sediminicurvatus halobius TaxID=2182432 RepID=UPI001E3840A0|nr:UDP-N-acetylmuramate:L-alanyl-gamma-D-glutamyl-meso-diaminopimelate ligase [Spiribacter halobius]UEX78602.1 UDP-N-acetylmuramate:L-alanyl-gamma-D-glutamyl-meso-diaminopimelate ligase [Spiribacter halobius]
MSHVHILGICGTFMAGVALLARASGHRVTGADAGVYPPMSTLLADQGIDVTEGYDPAALEPAPDCVVVGNALSRGNPSVEAVLERDLPFTSGPQWLAEHVLRGRWVLAVAGTHGKTTTASLLAWLLEDAGLAPGFLIGGLPGNFGVSARLGEGPFFVIEADEYDSAFFDKRSKFVHFRPRTLVLNNLEYDHADIFPDLAAIQRQFHHLVRTVPGSGQILVNGDDAALEVVMEMGCWSVQTRFGTGADNDWRLGADNGDWHLQDLPFTPPLPGAHNARNTAAALLAARHAGVPLAQGAASLAGFRGIRRRLESRGRAAGVEVLDDFAHHPTAIAATIGALAAGRSGRLLAVLEPRSNTMRQGVHRGQLADALAGADLAFVLEPSGLDWDLAAALAPLGERARTATTVDALIAAIVHECHAGDTVLVMSNGGFEGIHERLLAALRTGGAQA